ncbi:DUF4326 domain-containing protein [Streptomyces sp. NPDC086549]|uniref:DUF4326 domain-containing protein n=1 Tax=Streptomyces sp. NPDC086549 TaxID=3365752 RepID=UPI00381E1C13
MLLGARIAPPPLPYAPHTLRTGNLGGCRTGRSSGDGRPAKRHKRFRGRPELLELVPDLRGKTLACWCAPEPYHADMPAEPADTDDVT